jgi:hypothetical protein
MSLNFKFKVSRHISCDFAKVSDEFQNVNESSQSHTLMMEHNPMYVQCDVR